jgi:hypothetical protein
MCQLPDASIPAREPSAVQGEADSLLGQFQGGRDPKVIRA